MFRLQDHLISLIAVFLALGLGIMIGTGLNENMLVTEQRLLIERLTADFQDLKEERGLLQANVTDLRQNLSLWEEYQQALYPQLVAGGSGGKKIFLVRQGAVLPENLLPLLADAQAELCGILQLAEGPLLSRDSKELGRFLGRLLQGAAANNAGTAETAALLAAEKISLAQLGPGPPDTLLLLLGERSVLAPNLLQGMLAECRAGGLRVIGLEWSSTADSWLTELKRQSLTTIDNIETVFGQSSLLAVLRGCRGNFGLKKAAEQFMAID